MKGRLSCLLTIKIHLTVQKRIIIEKGIENGSTKAAIALTIGKDKSTVGKEIKKHRELVHKSSYKINCANMKTVLTIMSVTIVLILNFHPQSS